MHYPGDIYGDQISKSQLNTSTSKFMFSFPRAERFKIQKNPSKNDSFYNLPDIKSKRTTTLGFGTKYDFTKESKDKCQAIYNIRKDYDKSVESPSYSFGVSREFYDKVYCETNRSIDKSIPGAGSINIRRPFGEDGRKFSIFGKGQNTDRPVKVKNELGPGEYKTISINMNGKYPISNMKNTCSVTFSLSKEKRFEYSKKENTPAPNHYEIKSLIDGKGISFISKYKSNGGVRIVGKGKDFNTLSSSMNSPGPGRYRVFSEFGIYSEIPKLNIEGKEKKQE